MKFGAARSEIVFPRLFLPTEGFTQQISSLYARVFVLENSVDADRFAFLSLELTSLPDANVDELKRLLSVVTGAEVQKSWVSVSHTFSVPHLILPNLSMTEEQVRKNQQFFCAIRKATEDAAKRATEALQNVSVSFGQAQCAVNANRDIETPDGWWIGTNGLGFSDKTLSVFCFNTEENNPVGIIIIYSIQSSIFDGASLSDGGRPVSSDLAGAVCQSFEEEHTGSVAFFIPGAAGDQAPIKKAIDFVIAEDGTVEIVDSSMQAPLFLKTLSVVMSSALKDTLPLTKVLNDPSFGLSSIRFSVPGKRMARDLKLLRPTRNYAYVADGEREITVEMLRIGSIRLLGVKPELNAKTLAQLQERSPFRYTLIVTMINGGAKYMADTDSYDRMTYEAMNSPFGQGAAEMFVEKAAEMLKEAYQESI